MDNSVAIERAIHLVMTAFGKQVRIGPKKIPAYTHSLSVGLALLEYGYDLETVLAGFLHDTLEDTAVTPMNIQRMFNARVRILVEACSYDKNIGDTPEGANELFERVVLLASKDESAPLAIKCVDIKVNLKTNADLKPEWQHSQFNRGHDWLAAGRQYLGDQLLLDDLKITLDREEKRLALLAP